jgi:hypothetical protein
MESKTKLALILSLIIVTLLFSSVSLTKANPEAYASMPRLQIESPKENATYSSSQISLVVTGQVLQRHFINQSSPIFRCALDGMHFNVSAKYEGGTSDGWLIFSGTNSMTALSNGLHNVSVSYISCSNNGGFSDSISFTIANSSSNVKDPVPPKFTVRFGGYYSFKVIPSVTIQPTPEGYQERIALIPLANFTITNQPIANYNQGNLKNDLYYYFRWKEHSNSSWIGGIAALKANTSDNSIYSLMVTHYEDPFAEHLSGLIDFQVAARFASLTTNNVYVGQISDWSSTQTVNIPPSTSSSNPAPISGLSWLIILPFLFAIPIVLMIVRRRLKKINN